MRVQSLRSECIRPGTPLSLEDAKRLIRGYVDRYNHVRLHSAIGCVTPSDTLAGRQTQITRRARPQGGGSLPASPTATAARGLRRAEKLNSTGQRKNFVTDAPIFESQPTARDPPLPR